MPASVVPAVCSKSLATPDLGCRGGGAFVPA